ncbi:c-type cytochrome [Paracnuella aquatica]|uniref:c-type cytochrome n=1 Tax=Paracnuella aquatica TaxID=2268757 RepID=UPI000DEEC169|nr:c-type cytochrome [Paracnuella aquatica]RPD51053.1 cytochrome c [Paracnuella aquatica]
MKKVLRYALYLLAAIVVLVGAFVAFIAIRGIPSYEPKITEAKVVATPERIAQGHKLSAMLCNGCHLDPNTNRLTGRLMSDVPQFGTIYSKNITQHPELGIGKWTDGELIYLLRTGIKPDGTFLPVMAKLSHASDEDLQSIVAFLRSEDPWVKADDTRHPDSKYSLLAKFLSTINAMKPGSVPATPVAQPDTSNTIAWGRYLAVDQLECFSCHSQDFAKNNYDEPEKSAGYFGGGNKMLNASGQAIYTRNITMDEQTGIGHWTEDQFVLALKYGRTPQGQALREPMMPYTYLTDGEAKAIYAYLKTLPKIQNKVERQ